MENSIALPSSIKRIIGDAALEPAAIGFCSKTFFIKEKKMVLKICDRKGELPKEVHMLDFLKGKLNVPRVIQFEQEENLDFLVISQMEGRMACDNFFKDKKEFLVELLIEALKLIRAVPDCKVIRDTETLVNLAKERTKNRLVNESVFEKEYKGMTAEQLLLVLLDKEPKTYEPVFSHGDFCLPNIIIHGETIGFIDLSCGGIADQYNDLGICTRSLRYNFDESFVQLFLKKWDPVDREKIAFFLLLDEFF